MADVLKNLGGLLSSPLCAFCEQSMVAVATDEFYGTSDEEALAEVLQGFGVEPDKVWICRDCRAVAPLRSVDHSAVFDSDERLNCPHCRTDLETFSPDIPVDPQNVVFYCSNCLHLGKTRMICGYRKLNEETWFLSPLDQAEMKRRLDCYCEAVRAAMKRKKGRRWSPPPAAGVCNRPLSDLLLELERDPAYVQRQLAASDPSEMRILRYAGAFDVEEEATPPPIAQGELPLPPCPAPDGLLEFSLNSAEPRLLTRPNPTFRKVWAYRGYFTLLVAIGLFASGIVSGALFVLGWIVFLISLCMLGYRYMGLAMRVEVCVEEGELIIRERNPFDTQDTKFSTIQEVRLTRYMPSLGTVITAELDSKDAKQMCEANRKGMGLSIRHNDERTLISMPTGAALTHWIGSFIEAVARSRGMWRGAQEEESE